MTWRSRGREVAAELGATLRLWFLGQFIDMAIVGLLLWLGLFLIGSPLAMSLALLAGLLNFSLMWARLPARFQQFSLPWLSLLFLRPGSLFYSLRFNCWRET